MRKIHATFEIVTPMFLGGAEHEAKHIRGASIKGALAFWWRALNYEKIFVEMNMDENTALEKLQEREQELFGGPDGQGRFLLRVVKQVTKEPRPKGGFLEGTRNTVDPGSRYLGYGLMEAFGSEAGKLERSAITHNQTFELQIILRPMTAKKDTKEDLSALEKKDFEEIVQALKLFGLLGGLGSRVRRGWGSVALKELTEEVSPPHKAIMAAYTRPTTIEVYKEQLKELIGVRTTSGINFPLTAFAKETVIRVGEKNNGKTPEDKIPHKTALAALNEIGEGFQRYRGYRAPQGRTSEKNFQGDHDWYRIDGGRPDSIPQRTAFGLPHNYSQTLGVTASNKGQETFDRRASPLMFHVHRLGNNQYVGVASFFPTKFLTNGEAAIWRGNTNNKTPKAYDFTSQGLPVIQSFLDNKKPNGTSTTPPYFPSTKLFP